MRSVRFPVKTLTQSAATSLSFCQDSTHVSYWQNSIEHCRTSLFIDIIHTGQPGSGEAYVRYPAHVIKKSVKIKSRLLFKELSIIRRKQKSAGT